MEFADPYATFVKARQFGTGAVFREMFADDWTRSGLFIASMLDDRSLVLLDARGIEVMPFDRRTT